jgi:chromate transporter
MSLEVTDTPSPAGPERPASCTDLFLTFTGLALQGFGGVLPVVQRELCERKRWLTKEQFLELLALAQVLPGPNVCNVSLMVGDRFYGARGAAAALAGMMSLPLLLVLALTALYAQFASNPIVAGALRGMGAVAAGLVIGTAFKLAGPLRRSPMGLTACLLLGFASFVMIALLRWPLVWVLLGLAPLAWGFAAWRLLRHQPGGRP